MEAHFIIAFLLASSLSISNLQAASSATSTSTLKTYTDYLRSVCKSTTYPPLCYNSLASYASKIQTNDLKLCNTALGISLKAANNASAVVKKLSKQQASLTKIESGIIRTCKAEVSDVIDELKQSIAILPSLKGSPEGEFLLASIKTYVSAAETDETTCTDELSARSKSVRPSISKKISKSITKLVKLTSNALALINKMNY